MVALRKQIDDLQRAAAKLMAQVEAFTPTGDAEIDSQWRGRLQQRFAEVANQTRVKTAELNKISSRQQRPRRLKPALLDRVPLIQFDLLDLPEEHQRRLFDAFHLELRYNRHLHQLTAKVTVYAETVDALRGAMPTLDDVRGRSSDEAGEPCTTRVPVQRGTVPGAHAPGTGSHVWRAPGRSRDRPASPTGQSGRTGQDRVGAEACPAA